MTREPASVVAAYFSCMRSRDPGVADLFHDDARLVGLGSEKNGKAAIREFYAGVIERAGPRPSLRGKLLVDGKRVAAEIVIELGDEATIHAVDLFEVEDGRIRSLTYFLSTH